LSPLRAQSVGCVDVSTANVGYGRGGVHHHERYGRDEDKHDFLFFTRAKQRKGQWDQRCNGNIAPEDVDRRKKRINPREAST